jgi:diguanylate cyclase (GGDEF)-like protein
MLVVIFVKLLPRTSQTMEKWETQESADIVLKVREAQILQLYKQTGGGLIGVLAIAFLVCIALWQVIPQWKLVVWVGALVLISIARALLCMAFQRKSPSGQRIFLWAHLNVVGITASSLMWTLPPFLLWPSDSPVHQEIWPICTVAMSAVAVAKYCSWTWAYIPYLLLSVVPISLRLLWEGQVVYVVLGMLGLLFAAVLAETGKVMHDAGLNSLLNGFRNEALNSVLSEEKAKQEELAHKLQTAHDQLRQLSLTDELTGLWNRRFLNVTISEDVAQVIRNYQNFRQGLEDSVPANNDIVFVMVDLDHFKNVNDSYGHSAGDHVLMQMRRLLTESCRKMDTVIRWGGEEFLVVARNVSRRNYTYLIERIRLAVESHRFDIGMKEPLRITCSIGASVFPFLASLPEGLRWDEVVEIADACLFAAKRSGRNIWVSVTPTDSASNEDITPDISKNLPLHIPKGKLEIKTNLPDTGAICWEEG